MDINDERIMEAVRRTEVLRLPRRSLTTFGVTNIHYYLVSEPAYSELVATESETVIREGKVVAERPRIVTPYYLAHLEGFSPSARRFFNSLVGTQGANAPGMLYSYKNEPAEMRIVADNLPSVIDKINQDIDDSGNPLTSIIKAQDDLWDVSLLKFIFELTRSSIPDNLRQMKGKGRLEFDARGLPADARVRIEESFAQAMRGEIEPQALKDELERWDVFEEYEDRFFSLFTR